MPKPDSYKAWSDHEDYLLISNQGRFTHQQIADELGRPRDSVRYRVQFLRKRGVKIATIKAGRSGGGEFVPTPDPLPFTTADVVDLCIEREAIVEECTRYLKGQIDIGNLSIERALLIAARIKQDVLQAPETNFQRMAQLPIEQIIFYCSQKPF